MYLDEVADADAGREGEGVVVEAGRDVEQCEDGAAEKERDQQGCGEAGRQAGRREGNRQAGKGGRGGRISCWVRSVDRRRTVACTGAVVTSMHDQS